MSRVADSDDIVKTKDRAATKVHLPPPEGDEGLPKMKAALFGLPSLALGAIQASYFFLPVYYLQYLKFQTAALGLIGAVASVVGVVVTLYVGYLSDVLKVRFGNRRRVMICVLPIVTLALIPRVWVPFEMTETKRAIWVGSFLILYNISFSIWNINFQAVGLSISDKYNHRSAIFYFSALGLAVGNLGGNLALGYLPQEYYSYYIAGCSAVYFCLCLPAAIVLPRTVPMKSRVRTQIVPAFVRCFKNGPFRVLCSAAFLGKVTYSKLLPVFVKFFLNTPQKYMGLSEAAKNVTRAVAYSFWTLLSRKLGKKLALQVMSITSLGMVAFPFAVTSWDTWQFWVFTIGGPILGGVGSQSIMTQSMLADVVDYDQLLWSEPTKREAIYQSVTGQATTMDSVVNSLSYLMLTAVGFKNAKDASDPSVRLGVECVFAAFCCPPLLSAIILCWYPITHQVHRRVIKRVRWLLEDEKIVEDPITHKLIYPVIASTRIPFLDHFSTAEIRTYINNGARGLRFRIGVHIFFWLCVIGGCVAPIVYTGLGGAEASPLATLCAVAVFVLVLNFQRLYAIGRLSQWSHADMQKHIIGPVPDKDTDIRIGTNSDYNSEVDPLLSREARSIQ